MADWIDGRQTIMAIGKGATWRTAVSVNTANAGVLFTSESLGAKAPTFLEDDSLGKDDIDDLIRTHEKMDGSFTAYLRFQDLDVPLAMTLGAAASPNLAGTLTYGATLSVNSNIDGIFGTIAIKKANTTDGIWEIPSAKFRGFTLTAQVGALAKMEFRLMGNRITTVAASVTNTSLASVTYPDTAIALMDGNFYLRMNSASASALSSSNNLHPNQVEVTYDRPEAEQYEAGYRDASEPVQNGFASGSIKLMFDKYNLDTFMDALDANGSNDFKAEIYFKGPLIEGSANKKYYSIKIQMPHVVWTVGQADVSGPGTIPHTVEGRFLQASSTPSGMQGTDPCYFIIQNKRSTNALA
jgi:hypothetical protein